MTDSIWFYLLACLTALAVASAASAGPATRPAGDPDLMLCLRGSNIHDNIAVDSSGRGHSASVASGDRLIVERVGGHVAFRCQGGKGALSADSSPDFDFTTDYTLCFHVRFATNTTYVTLLSRQDKRGGVCFVHNPLGDAGSSWGLALLGSVIGTMPTTFHPAIDDWDHVALTFEKGRYLLYVNGRSLATLADQQAIPAISSSLRIGAASAEGTPGLDGWIDDVRIYRRALKIEDVRLVMADKELPNPYGTLTDREAREARQMVRKLDSDDFDERQAAQRALAAMGRKVYPVLREMRDSGSAEMALRVKDLLNELPAPAPSTEPTTPTPPAHPPAIDITDFIFPVPLD